MPKGDNFKGKKPKNGFTKDTPKDVFSKGGKKSGEVRRREANLTACLREELIKMSPDGEVVELEVVQSLIAEAKKGNVAAIKEVFDRIDGKVKDNVEVQQNGNITMKFGWAARAGRPDKQLSEEENNSIVNGTGITDNA